MKFSELLKIPKGTFVTFLNGRCGSLVRWQEPSEIGVHLNGNVIRWIEASRIIKKGNTLVETMKIEIQPNSSLEGYDLIDTSSDQSRDGDNAKEVVATVYGLENALILAKALDLTFDF